MPAKARSETGSEDEVAGEGCPDEGRKDASDDDQRDYSSFISASGIERVSHEVSCPEEKKTMLRG